MKKEVLWMWSAILLVAHSSHLWKRKLTLPPLPDLTGFFCLRRLRYWALSASAWACSFAAVRLQPSQNKEQITYTTWLRPNPSLFVVHHVAAALFVKAASEEGRGGWGGQEEASPGPYLPSKSSGQDLREWLRRSDSRVSPRRRSN